MKTAQHLATLLLTFVLITACQEEDLITGKISSNTAISPTTGGGHPQDSDGDGVPDSEDECPDEYAYNDSDEDGCEDEGFITMHQTSFARFAARRPKPCEYPINCEEERKFTLGEVLIGLYPEVMLKSAEATVYNAKKVVVGSSTEAHGGSIAFSKSGALLEVGLSDTQYKEETLLIMVKAKLVVEGKEVKEEVPFKWAPDDF